MKIRLTCTHCHASFLATNEQLGQLVSCPKCGNSARMPRTIDEVVRLASSASFASPPAPAGPDAVAPAPPPPAARTIADADDDEAIGRRRRRRRRLAPFLVGTAAGLVVASLILLPLLRRPEPAEPVAPRPADPAEQAARRFLDALVSGDAEAVDRLSTIADPPAIASYDDAQRDPGAGETIRGSFAPIAALHREIGRKYVYRPESRRFENADPLDVAADFMDEADRARVENEQSTVYDRIAGGTADEQLDAAIEFAESFAKLTEALPRRELVPTYEQLARDAEPPLPADAQDLALRYGEDPDTWDGLLGRPFFTIEADGPFVLEEAQVVATVRDALASPTDPDRRLRLRLARFRLDAIDTGWKVVSARREDLEPAAPTPSPGESPSPGLEPTPAP